MSNAALNWAKRARTGDATSKLVLLLLADAANGDARAWPSLNTLSRQSELDRRTVMRKLEQLEAGGFIQRLRQRGDDQVWSVTTYVLGLEGVGAPCPYPRGSVPLGGRGTVPPKPLPLEPLPLPPGWTPNRNDVAEMQRRYPELDLDASTERFVSHFTETAKTHHDWAQRWRSWIAEDGSDPKRTKRTATRTARTERLGERNRRRANAALARLAALPNNGARGDR